MNGDVIDDLKQFISTAIWQANSEVLGRLDRMESRLDGVESRLDHVEDRLDGMATKEDIADLDAKLDTIAETFSEELRDHDRRIVRLEQQAA